MCFLFFFKSYRSTWYVSIKPWKGSLYKRNFTDNIGNNKCEKGSHFRIRNQCERETEPTYITRK